MTAIILDKSLERRLIARRRRLDIDHWDEFQHAVYVMAPAADIEHFGVSNDLATVLTIVVKWAGLGDVLPGVNISDRNEDWKKNFRVPDVSVFLKGNPAEDCDAFWFGGPDFAVEIVSPNDRTRKKIPFYEKVGTRAVDRRSPAVEAHIASADRREATRGGSINREKSAAACKRGCAA